MRNVLPSGPRTVAAKRTRNGLPSGSLAVKTKSCGYHRVTSSAEGAAGNARPRNAVNTSTVSVPAQSFEANGRMETTSQSEELERSKNHRGRYSDLILIHTRNQHEVRGLADPGCGSSEAGR